MQELLWGGRRRDCKAASRKRFKAVSALLSGVALVEHWQRKRRQQQQHCRQQEGLGAGDHTMMRAYLISASGGEGYNTMQERQRQR